MPKKLMDCVKKLMKQGKTESQAFAICIASIGLKPEHDNIKKAIQKKYPKLKEEKIDKYIMKAYEPLVDNLISRPTSVESNIMSQYDKDALPYLIYLRKLTKDKKINEPIDAPIDNKENKFFIHLHSKELGIFSGYLMDEGKNIVLEFHDQTLPIIASMIAIKAGIIDSNEEIEQNDDNNNNIATNESKKVQITLNPKDESIHIKMIKSLKNNIKILKEKIQIYKGDKNV